MFGWREAYITFSMNDFAKARDALALKGIRYKFKTRSQESAGLGMATDRSHYGSFGIDPQYSYEYTLYVKKQDFEQAQCLINKALH